MSFVNTIRQSSIVSTVVKFSLHKIDKILLLQGPSIIMNFLIPQPTNDNISFIFNYTTGIQHKNNNSIIIIETYIGQESGHIKNNLQQNYQ